MAFILAIAIAVIGGIVAFLAEYARGMASAPSMHPSCFWSILIPSWVLAALVALSHYLPHFSW